MKIKPNKNERSEAWQKYFDECSAAKKEYKNRVRVAKELLEKCLKRLDAHAKSGQKRTQNQGNV